MKKSAQQTTGRLGGGRDDYQKQSPSASYSLSQNDRMHIFMSASKQLAASADSTLEKNARIFKWLHNCKNARDSN